MRVFILFNNLQKQTGILPSIVETETELVHCLLAKFALKSLRHISIIDSKSSTQYKLIFLYYRKSLSKLAHIHFY